jgi:hypothetical protein
LVKTGCIPHRTLISRHEDRLMKMGDFGPFRVGFRVRRYDFSTNPKARLDDSFTAEVAKPFSPALAGEKAFRLIRSRWNDFNEGSPTANFPQKFAKIALKSADVFSPLRHLVHLDALS